ncbi:hypothetical protein GCK72_000408 [Caenorhabditis remanei]|uniref:DUF38 domain-containing protein n=1 Tax=Caenorhabditis remanei TaxID=31234 RepID=A0A6A5HPJ6_CAERE|nr:hypothetical protein GCK72_000408 [Caenorhabditis remanei]KAF1768596.1 hypothetical protein GCK72_000408 [Caenorhabditis remanei]
MSELLFRKVLNNEHLLENILDHLSEDFTKNVSIRLVNSSFNANFLRSIRLNYRRMKMECIGAPENVFYPETIKDHIYINYRKVKKTVVPNYFRFLRNVAKVKVEEIIVKNISNAGRVFAEKFHDLVYNELIGSNRANVSKLIGLGELCAECDDCNEMIHQCREYGPVLFDTLCRLSSFKIFDKLHVTSRTLEDFANFCSFFAGCKEDSVVLLDSVVRPEISVDHLVLWINESKVFYENGVKKRDHYYMPREVIDIMLKRSQDKPRIRQAVTVTLLF